MAPLLGADGKPVGQIFLNADWVDAIGYSGKPIEILIAIDPKGVITGPDQLHVSYVHTPVRYAWDQMQPQNMELRMLKMGETFTLD